MAIYTTQLRSIVEQAQADAHVGPDDFTVAYARLGLNDYPIFDESYRQPLNDKIIRHYYFQEIGAETVARFAWYVRMTMFEMMPFYNQLYNSLNLITDPLTNVQYTYQDVITESKTDAGTSSQTTSGQTSRNETETHDGDDVTEAAKGAAKTETLQHGHYVTEDMTHGHEIVEDFAHGHVETDTTTYGHEIDESSSTTYGRTQATVNGGSDQTLEGATHEREIRSDTPMNQIPAGGVENLNYATEVTYTDREGQRAGSTTYGGTTNVTYGGTDSETGSTEHGGVDVLQKLNEGTDTTTTTNSGTDTKTVSNTGADTTTTTTSGADTTTLSHGEEITTVETGTSSGSKSETDSRTTDTDGTRSHERIGYDGISQSKLIEEFRKTFLNVDLQVINSLQQCFFGLWA